MLLEFLLHLLLKFLTGSQQNRCDVSGHYSVTNGNKHRKGPNVFGLTQIHSSVKSRHSITPYKFSYIIKLALLDSLASTMWQTKKWKTNSGHLVHTTSAKIVKTRLKRVLCECDVKRHANGAVEPCDS
jgi:hypothetical protein